MLPFDLITMLSLKIPIYTFKIKNILDHFQPRAIIYLYLFIYLFIYLFKLFLDHQ